MKTYGLGLGNNNIADDSNARSFLPGANPLPGGRGTALSAIYFQAQKDELKREIVSPPLLRDGCT